MPFVCHVLLKNVRFPAIFRRALRLLLPDAVLMSVFR